MPKWTTDEIPDQTGRIAVITGANSGLGYATTLALAGKGAHVVMACRNLEKGQAALDEIVARIGDARLELMELDLASVASIRSFAESYRSRHETLDMLINNAGVMAVPRSETEDGFEIQLGVNHLGHFALTGLLLPVLLSTPDSRVVTVTSMMHRISSIDFDDLMSEESYSRYGAYAQSKLANLLFACELQHRLSTAGADTISVVVHPGYVDTAAQSNSGESVGLRIEMMMYGVINKLFAQSPTEGAKSLLYAATMPDVQGGELWRPKWVARGYPERVSAKPDAYDEEVAARLWEVSEELTGVVYEFDAPETHPQASAEP